MKIIFILISLIFSCNTLHATEIQELIKKLPVISEKDIQESNQQFKVSWGTPKKAINFEKEGKEYSIVLIKFEGSNDEFLKVSIKSEEESYLFQIIIKNERITSFHRNNNQKSSNFYPQGSSLEKFSTMIEVEAKQIISKELKNINKFLNSKELLVHKGKQLLSLILLKI